MNFANVANTGSEYLQHCVQLLAGLWRATIKCLPSGNRVVLEGPSPTSPCLLYDDRRYCNSPSAMTGIWNECQFTEKRVKSSQAAPLNGRHGVDLGVFACGVWLFLSTFPLIFLQFASLSCRLELGCTPQGICLDGSECVLFYLGSSYRLYSFR